MLIEFIGQCPEDPTQSVTFYGIEFVRHVPVFVTDGLAISKLSHNGHFRVLSDGNECGNPKPSAEEVGRVSQRPNTRRKRGQQRIDGL